MHTLIATVVMAALLAAPEPAQDDAAALVEKLRSGTLEEREEATAKLKALGKAAVPDLEKAAKDEDAEVATRARRLLSLIKICEELSPNILKAMPGIDERLASGEAGEWSRTFYQVLRKDTLEREDLGRLAAGALRRAARDAEKISICRVAAGSMLTSATPEIVKLLKDEDELVRVTVITSLGKLGAKEAVPRIMELLKDSRRIVRAVAGDAVARLGGKEAIPALTELLKEEYAPLRIDVAGVLGRIRGPGGDFDPRRAAQGPR